MKKIPTLFERKFENHKSGEFWTKAEGDAIAQAFYGNLTKWENIYD